LNLSLSLGLSRAWLRSLSPSLSTSRLTLSEMRETSLDLGTTGERKRGLAARTRTGEKNPSLGNVREGGRRNSRAGSSSGKVGDGSGRDGCPGCELG
jgi:hypothetical protein